MRNPILLCWAVSAALLGPPAASAQNSDRPVMMRTETAVRMFQARVKRNPKDFRSLAVLGTLYMRQAREADDFAGFVRAERTFRDALKARPDFIAVRASLASALAAQHKFADAAKEAEAALKNNPKPAAALAALGDARMELGQYDAADAAFAKLVKYGKSPAVLVRLARMKELRGRPEAALTMLRDALKQSRESAQPARRLAWYEWRLGKSLWDAGRTEKAAGHFRAALTEVPDYAPALAGLAATLAARGELGASAAAYRKAVAATPTPPTLAALGDVLTKQGDAAAAKVAYGRAAESIAEEQADAAAGPAHRREAILFYADRGVKLDEAVQLARLDLGERQDVYTHDALAWALHKAGKTAEAKAEIRKALRLGTLDARLLHHAGMIHAAAGDREAAAKYLRQALKINPQFDPLAADAARAELKSQ